ncbi:MAG: restriction endonuclease subunit S [Fimbriimonadaceae bacterium]|nr:restriction endonuclease subunit S [Fimbriimonadaceae bacterium]
MNAPAIRREVAGLQSGTTRKRISRSNLAKIELIVPPIREQERIADHIDEQFSRLDTGVEALKRGLANLKRYRASVLKAACEGRLVPTEPELTRRAGADRPCESVPIRYESGDALLARILAERRRTWTGKGKYKEPAAPDTTNLPDLPEGWTWASVDQLARVGTGATPKRGTAAFYDSATIPWVTSGALNSEYVDSAKEFVTQAALRRTNLTLYGVGTLLVAMYGEGKTRGKCSELRISATTNQAIAALVVQESIRPYLKVCLRSQYETMRRAASGGVQPNLNISIIRQIAVPLPPAVEQERIVAEVERRLSVADSLEATLTATLRRATRLRQAVLRSAFRD